jgi:DNA-binding transcriptional LysR family regulator
VRTNLNLAQIETFVSVAESRSFRAAADQLCISPPAVSARIQQLEQSLGVQLFNRTTRSVSLTSEGQRLYASASRALSELLRMTRQLESESALTTGRVHFAALVSITSSSMPALLSEFSKRHPGLLVTVLDVLSNGAAKAVLDGDVDFALSSLSVARKGLMFEPLYSEACDALVRFDHPLAALDSVRLEQLAQYPLLSPPKGTQLHGILTSAFAARGIAFEPRHEANASSTIVALVDQGHGIAFLSAGHLLHLRTEHTKALRIDPNPVRRDIGIVTAEGRSLSPAARTLRNFLVDKLTDPAIAARTGS